MLFVADLGYFLASDQEDALGVIIDEDGKEKELLFLKSGDVYKLDLDSIE